MHVGLASSLIYMQHGLPTSSFSSYTTGIIILQAAVQKILCGYAPELWTADVDLVSTCIETLNLCKMDDIAMQFRDLLNHFMQIIEAAVDGQIDIDPSKANAVLDNGEYLFAICAGDTDLHKLSRDLLRLLRQPFDRDLEVVPEGGLLVPSIQLTLTNCAEAAIGASLEWTTELQSYRNELNAKHVDGMEDDGEDPTNIGIVSQLSPGRYMDGDGDQLGQSVWSPFSRPY